MATHNCLTFDPFYDVFAMHLINMIQNRIQ